MTQSVKQTDKKQIDSSNENTIDICLSAFSKIVESSVLCGIFTIDNKEEISIRKPTSVGKSFSV